MKRKPLSKGEWALIIVPVFFLIALAWVPLAPLREAWIIRKNRAQPLWLTLAWSPDSRFVAMGGGVRVYEQPVPGKPSTKRLLERGDLHLYDAEGNFVRSLVGHGSVVNKAEFSPDGKLLLGVTSGGLRVWDVATGRQRSKSKLAYPTLQWSKDGKTIVGTAEQIVYPPGGAKRPTFVDIYCHIDPTTGVVTVTPPPSAKEKDERIKSPSGFTAIRRPLVEHRQPGTGFFDAQTIRTGGEVDIFDASGRKQQTLYDQTGFDMTWRGDHNLVSLCPIKGTGQHQSNQTLGMMLLTVNVRDRTQQSRMLQLEPFEKWSGPGSSDRDNPTYGKISSDGRYAVIWSYQTIWLVDVATAATIASRPLSRVNVPNFEFSPDGSSLAWIDDSTLHVINVRTGRGT